MIPEDNMECSNQITTGCNGSDNLMKELDQFLAVASNAISNCNPSNPLTQEELKTSTSSLKLLKTLPPARAAILAYLGHLLGKQVYSYMRSSNREADAKSPNGVLASELATIVEEQLTSHIEEETGESGGGLWCELVCGWGVEMLSMWGTEWSNINGILVEVVATWLNCTSVKTVVSLITLCVAKEPQGAVAHILNTAAHCSPTLDWLVAHIGASHPAPVLSHLLDPSVQVSLDADKLDRTTNILSHLSIQHSGAVCQALTSLFLRTVHGHCWPGAGPQLLLLLTRSSRLLDTISSSIPELLTTSTLNRMASQCPSWVPTYFRTWAEVQNRCVQLILDCNSPSLLLLLMQSVHSPIPIALKEDDLLPLVKNSMATLLNRLLTKLLELCYEKGNPRRNELCYEKGNPRLNVPLLLSVGDAKSFIDYAMGSNNRFAVQEVTQLITMCSSLQMNPNRWCYVLRNFPPSPYLLQMAARITLTVVRDGNHVRNSDSNSALVLLLSSIISKAGKGLNNAIATLDLLVSSPLLNAPISDAICALLPRFAQLINIHGVGDNVMKLLSKVKLKLPLSLAHTSVLSHAIVTHLMCTLEMTEMSQKLTVVSYCSKLLAQLSRSSCGQGLITRLLVESVFRPEWSPIFGATVKDSGRTVRASCDYGAPSSGSQKQLLKANYNFDSWVNMPLSHTTIFHAGTISSNRKSTVRKAVPPSVVSTNIQLLLNTLSTVSAHHEQNAPLTIAFLLVEIISPDIMYNGFPWPDENIKFTIERDLAIKKTFEEYQIAWEFLELVASYRPSLCFCSVLVRALTASYISIWSNSPLSKCKDTPKQLRSTERLLEIMVTGQFLPSNLQVLPQMMEHLAPHEAVSILQEVWNYMRDNTPSPNRLQERGNQLADPRSFEVCRRMIVLHIEPLGHLLPNLLSGSTQHRNAVFST